jgi:hypothetical protein
MQVSGQLEAPAALHQGETPVPIEQKAWVGLRVALDFSEKRKFFAPTENRTPERPALSLLTTHTELSRHAWGEHYS